MTRTVRTTRKEGETIIIKSKDDEIIIKVGKIRYTEAQNRKVDLAIEIGPTFQIEIIKEGKKIKSF